MDLLEAIKKRHSVRQYKDKPIEGEVLAELKNEIEICNRESGLNIQLVLNEPKAFDCFMAHYGRFEGVSSYIAVVGKKDKEFDEKCGYYGERIVLRAQQLGLNTCWAAISYTKVPDAFFIGKGEKLALVISVGYGRHRGLPRKSKRAEQVSNISENTPEWFEKGVQAALLAPTATNQQQFYLEYKDGKVSARAKLGFYAKLDLGIVKYHFEIGAGKENFEWS